MRATFDPIIGNWYYHRNGEKGQVFSVVAVEDSGTVETQHIDGDLEAIEAVEWGQLDLELAQEPEDWTGPIDDIEYDDLGYSETAMSSADHESALSEITDHRENWQIDEDIDPDRLRDQREVPLSPEHC